MSQILIRPLITEKMTKQGETLGRYGFEVARTSNKLEIKQAVEKHFGKKVEGVRTANFAGKARRERRADYGRTNHYKKAIVRLKEGERIDLV